VWTGGWLSAWARFRWYNPVMIREDENSVKRIMMAEVNG